MPILALNFNFEIPDLSTTFTRKFLINFGKTEKQFKNTVQLAKAADFTYAYVAKYSCRPNTAATKAFADDVSHKEKNRRWLILDQLINHKGSQRSAIK